MSRYRNVMRAVTETPWAIRAEKLVVIRELLALRAAGHRLTDEDIEERIGDGQARHAAMRERNQAVEARLVAARNAGGEQTGTVAVLPLYGVIIPRATMFSQMSGGTAMQDFMASFRAAMASPDVGAILIDVDSPGGMTDLVPEAAAEIRDARGKKPIVAIANTDAASAAYWLASQADEVVVTPSGLVGSIGVFAAHEDISAQQEQDGVRTTLISAGKYKVESNPFEPLNEEARAAIQSRVDTFYGMFTKDVAKGRKVPIDAVRGGFGEGRVVTAQEAVRERMADRVDTFEGSVERLIVQAATGQRGKAAALGPITSDSAIRLAPVNVESSVSVAVDRAAESGLLVASFARAAVEASERAVQIVADTESLADVRERGRLTAAKREVLAQCQADFESAGAALAQLLADTDPARERRQAEGQRVWLEYVRSTLP